MIALPLGAATLWATALGVVLLAVRSGDPGGGGYSGSSASGGAASVSDAAGEDVAGSSGSGAGAAALLELLGPIQQVFSPMLAAISFLLVFRLSRAAVRYWDARAAAGKMVELCRGIVSETAVCCAHNPEQRRAIARWSAVFPIAVKNFLRPDPPDLTSPDWAMSATKHHRELLPL